MNRKSFIWTSSLLAMTLWMSACSKDSGKTSPEKEEQTDKIFAIGAQVLSPAGAYLFETPNFESGEISFLGNGANVTTQTPGFMAFMQNKGYYYAYITETNTLSQYSYKNQKLELVKAIPFTLENSFRYGHTWIDDHTLFVYALFGDYKIVDVNTMSIIKQGKISLPQKSGFNGPNIGFATVKDNKLYIGFSYAYADKVYSKKYPERTNYFSGTAHFAVYDYPAMDQVVYSEDSRSTWPGNDRNGVLKTFVYNDDLYVITTTSELSGGNWDKPTSLYRFKKDAKKIDENYYFNISEKLNGDNCLGGAYAGNGKLLLRRLRQDLVKIWGDYGFANVQEYHVIDLANQSISKLDIPLSKSLATAPNVIADPTDNKAYFTINTKDSNGEFNVYQYNSLTNTVTKGAKINSVDQVNVLFKIK